jgi:inosine-uridine nucleoside N-ribohydrolase
VRRVHLDTDIGTNPDDACALAMLLGLADVELVGLTTSRDPDGDRVGAAREVLALAGRTDVPVQQGGTADADALLAASVRAGATVVVAGSATNVAGLAGAHVVMMGGWLGTERLPSGFPPWGPARDTNVQVDVPAFEQLVGTAASLTLVPFATTVHVPLRRRDLAAVGASGPLGAYLVAASERYAVASGVAELADAHPALPADLVAFLHDPLAGATAAGWDGIRTTTERVRPVVDDGVLHLERDDSGREVTLVVDVDAEAFRAFWLDAVRAAQQRG